jgi:MarR family transcriptional regulator, organic hydroperoxide resistance regulator
MIQSEEGKIGHCLMNVCRMRGKMADQFMGKKRLFRGQGILLMFISQNRGLTQTEIADWLKISPSAATKVIKRLEQEGYLERRSDEKDDRVSRVFIRPAGLAVIEDVESTFKRLDDKTFMGFTKDELNSFGNYLVRIQENLQRE